MSNSRPKLPDFERPPVSEVALSIQFEPLVEMRAINLGSLWERFGKKQFPSVEEQPTVPRTFERFGPHNVPFSPQFELLNLPPLPRTLFVSVSGTEVIQVQTDRFTFNWRKRSDSDVYPRYEVVERQFIRFFQLFAGFVKDEKLGRIKIDQAEVTYVNQIVHAELGDRVDKVLSVISGDFTRSHLQHPEWMHLSLKYLLAEGNLPYGRLHVDATRGTQTDSPSLGLTLLARGRPAGTDIKAATNFFNAGRAAIVNGFASITSTAMHKAWGRTDDVADIN